MASRNLQAEMDQWTKKRDLQAEMDAFKTSREPVVEPEKESDQPWYGSVSGAVEDWKDFSEGIGVSGLETYYGLKDLMGMGEETSMSDLVAGQKTKKQPETLKRWREAAGRSGWGTAGEITGELAQLALPAGAALRTAKALSAANKASKTAAALPFATDMASITGLAATKLPEEGETRLGNALTAAEYGVGGAVAGKVLKTALAGAKGTQAAQRLRDAGAKLTAGQTLGKGAANLENILSIMPFMARPLARARLKSEESIHRIALKNAAAPGKGAPKEMGQKGIKELYKGYQEGYDKAWGLMNELSDGLGGRIDYVSKNGMKSLSNGKKRVVQNVLNDMNDVYKANPTGSAQKLDVLIKNAMVGSKKTREVDRVLKDIQSTLRSSLPKESQTALSGLDRQWPKYLAVEGAAATPAAAQRAKVGVPGEFGVNELSTGSRQVGKKRLTGQGDAPQQDLVNDWFTVKGQERGIIPTKALRVIQSPLFSDYSGLQGTINRRIAGTGLGQKQARSMYESELADKLRYGISPARFGAAYQDQ